ncbi:DUF3168 domain-containing protein [Roseibium sp. CAU 1637]|uniref:DUF3168 domain-containing protein n=1 Tax=Roseibium limicola TaxID=2816037 RepID=A0A939EQF1_9HYPH|nr:DUF3168 domain-containing protein [Roseibium limicola]MBO0345199.1 DUF3168 domain-containing protein [Roseibium limicola]
MSHAALALRAGLFARLSADADLTSRIGANRIFDAAPRNQKFPFVVLAALGSRPLLTRVDEGEVHELVLAVFSRAASRDEALGGVQRAARLLMDEPPELTGHRLIGLQVTEVTSRLMRDGRTFRAEASLRAVTEPQA